MVLFVSIPRDVLCLLSNYLLLSEEHNKQVFRFSSAWRNLLNTNKASFGEWKKQSQVVVLRFSYAEKFISSSQFRKRILRTIVDPLHQLELRFLPKNEIDCFQRLETVAGLMEGFKSLIVSNSKMVHLPFVLEEISLTGCSIADLERFPPLKKLSLSYCTTGTEEDGSTTVNAALLKGISEEVSFWCMDLENYEVLSHVKSICIALTDSVSDVSFFRNLEKVHFQSCPNIVDVSSLENIRELKLIDCNGITNVSSLGKVYNLDLSECTNLTDVSALGNVHILNLNWCSRVRNISMLNNVYELHLCGFEGDDLTGLNNLRKLFLTFAFYVDDISMLKNLIVLNIDQCPGISHFTGLNNLRAIKLGASSELSNEATLFKVHSGYEVFSKLNTLHAHRVFFEEEEGHSINSNFSFKFLRTLRGLKLDYCHFPRFPEMLFVQLKSLHILHCSGLESLPELPDLEELIIRECCQLRKLMLSDSKGGQNPIYFVEISDCPALKSMKNTRRIDHIKVIRCKLLTNLVVNSQIDILTTKVCPKFAISGFASVIQHFSTGDQDVDNYLSEYYQDD
jgi:hypothetical protein